MDLARLVSSPLDVSVRSVFGLKGLRTGAVHEVGKAEPCGAVNNVEPSVDSRCGALILDEDWQGSRTGTRRCCSPGRFCEAWTVMSLWSVLSVTGCVE